MTTRRQTDPWHPLLLTILSVALGFGSGGSQARENTGSIVVDELTVTYRQTSTPGQVEFSCTEKGYRNTYLLDCAGRRFLWSSNVLLATGQRTDNTAGAEWRAMGSGSHKANAVHAQACAAPPVEKPQPIILPVEPEPVPFSGESGRWGWEGSRARTFFRSGVSLYVLFRQDLGCHVADFAITGNDAIDSIFFVIDDHPFYPVRPRTVLGKDGAPVSHFSLSPTALDLIKSGRSMNVYTNAVDLWVTLDGSSRAIDAAWHNCEQAIAEPSPGTLSRVEQVSGPNGPEVHFTGKFSFGDADRVRRLLRETSARTLVLDSRGGSVLEAKDLGHFVRTQGVSTRAEQVCASACVFVLAAGVQRTAAPGAQIGVHQVVRPDGGGTLEEGQQVTADNHEYFKSMGVDTELAIIAARVSHDDIYWLTEEEMTKFRLITASSIDTAPPAPRPKPPTDAVPATSATAATIIPSSAESPTPETARMPDSDSTDPSKFTLPIVPPSAPEAVVTPDNKSPTP